MMIERERQRGELDTHRFVEKNLIYGRHISPPAVLWILMTA